MFYIARGSPPGSSPAGSSRLPGELQSDRPQDRSRSCAISTSAGARRPAASTRQAVSVQSILLVVLALIAGIVLGYTPVGQKVYATGGNRRAADYAGIDTERVRFWRLVFCGALRRHGRHHLRRLFPQLQPVAGQFRELDGIASVIIGGGSIFGGYGTIIGALAGAAVITLIRALLSLQIILADGSSLSCRSTGSTCSSA